MSFYLLFGRFHPRKVSPTPRINRKICIAFCDLIPEYSFEECGYLQVLGALCRRRSQDHPLRTSRHPIRIKLDHTGCWVTKPLGPAPHNNIIRAVVTKCATL